MNARKRILIVDDEPNVRLMLETTLASVGYEVAQACDGQAALELLEGPGPDHDLILLDLLMPRMDGMQLLRELRSRGIVVPVVILTAHGSIPEAVEAMKLGAIDFLAKPTTPDALRKVVAEVIERHALVDRAAEPAAASPRPPDSPGQFALELARAKRAINRGQFSEAETLLRDVLSRGVRSTDAQQLLERLETLKAREAHGSFRILRDWFPSGTARRKN